MIESTNLAKTVVVLLIVCVLLRLDLAEIIMVIAPLTVPLV